MTDLSKDEKLVARFAQQIGQAFSHKVPGSETEDGSYISQHLVTEDQARALARIFFRMIDEHEYHK